MIQLDGWCHIFNEKKIIFLAFGHRIYYIESLPDSAAERKNK